MNPTAWKLIASLAAAFLTMLPASAFAVAPPYGVRSMIRAAG